MRQKYIDERWPPLIQLGYHAVTKQPFVTDSAGNIDILVGCDESAKELVAHFEKLREEFSALARAFDTHNPEAFSAFWYNR